MKEKGKGFVILLHGPLGVGKTLSAGESQQLNDEQVEKREEILSGLGAIKKAENGSSFSMVARSEAFWSRWRRWRYKETRG
ncbi:hypothetical protein I7I48_04396 [Histoplasma ohiense]|nr:hypothetical protein I7I48_04396 [Histoplasma ohiense (nom. inval.)]